MKNRNIEYIFVIGYNDDKQLDQVVATSKKNLEEFRVYHPTTIDEINSAIEFFNVEENKSDNILEPEYIIFSIDLDEIEFRIEPFMDYYLDFVEKCMHMGITSQLLLALKPNQTDKDDKNFQYIFSRLEDSPVNNNGIVDGILSRKQMGEMIQQSNMENLYEEFSWRSEIDLDIGSFAELLDGFDKVGDLLEKKDKVVLSNKIRETMVTFMNTLQENYK